MPSEPSAQALFELIEYSAREVDEALDSLRRATAALHSSCFDLLHWVERSRAQAGGRRTGAERRAGVDRRHTAPEGLAARIFSSTERRKRADRRTGADRRVTARALTG